MSPFKDWKVGHAWSSLSSSSKDDLDLEEKFLDSPTTERRSLDSTIVDEESVDGKAISTPQFRNRERCSKGLKGLTIANVLLFGGSLFINGFHLLPWASNELNKCVKETSYYSPILDVEPIEFRDVHFNGTLWPPEDMAWSRREPGEPEMEKIWEDFEPVDTFPITREQVIALGKDPETAARYPDDYWGMGDDAYIASLDSLHKIHCLNELRKMTFADYGEVTPAKKQHGQLWWIHLRHCVDMLTQDQLCHADADLLTYNWMDTQRHPFPDFAINRKCKSLDPLFKYRDERMVNMKKYMAMPKPEAGITQVPNEPGYYAMFGFDGSDLFPNGTGHGPLPDTSKWFGIKPHRDEHGQLHN